MSGRVVERAYAHGRGTLAVCKHGRCIVHTHVGMVLVNACDGLDSDADDELPRHHLWVPADTAAERARRLAPFEADPCAESTSSSPSR